MNHGDYVPFLYIVAEKMKSHEFDESYFNIQIDNVNDFNSDKCQVQTSTRSQYFKRQTR